MKLCVRCNSTFASSQWTCPDCGYTPQEFNGFASFAPELSENIESYDAHRYAAIAAVERTHFWFRGRNDIIVSALRRHFPNVGSLMELGCGTGQVLESIRAIKARLRLVGTEIHLPGLEYSRQRLPEVEFLQMDARAIPFAEEFDVVCAFDVIEHIQEDTEVLAQMYRACRPGGGILITVPQHRWLWSHKDEFAHHKRRYSRAELEEKVTKAGFRDIVATSLISLLLPLLYMSRLRERSPADFDPQRELVIHPALNQACLALMRIESAFIRGGASLPAGGSLLLVAKKI